MAGDVSGDVNSRSRSHLGSRRCAGWSARASVCIQEVSSTAKATMASRIWLWVNSCHGSLVRLVFLAVRMRSS